MTNREESNAAEHETFPGPGPLRADEAKRGIHPVEQMVDAAIDRIARENEAARDSDPNQLDPGRLTPDRMTLERLDPGHALALAPQNGPSTLATAASVRRAKGRLRWKGLDVSEEFRSYADRVARGEDLPPFQGKILAEPDPAFPWDPAAKLREHSRVLKQQFGLWTGVALFLGLSVWVLVVQVGKQTDASQRAAESPLATVVLGNQPGSDAPKLGAPAVVQAATSEEATEPSPTLAAQGTTALASLQERSSPPARTAPANTSALRPAAASASANSRATASTPNSVGVFVATRPATGDVAGSNGSAGEVLHAAPSASNMAAAVSPHVVGAGIVGAGVVVGAGTNVGASAPNGAAVAAAAASPTDPGASAAAHTDPKKEPGREASTMGPLLVEKPSF